LGIYRTLSEKRPDDESLRHQIQEIEERVLRRRREPTPATPIDTAPMDAISGDDAGEGEHFAEAVPRSVGPTIRDFLLGIIRRGATNVVRHEPSQPQAEQEGGTIDALFDSGGELDDDLLAADTLSQAFAPEPPSEGLHGRP